MRLPYRLAICTAVLVLFPPPAHAQEFWHQTNGPLGGVVSGFVPTPSGSLVVLIDYRTMFRLDPFTYQWDRIGTSLPKSTWQVFSGRPGAIYAFGRVSPEPHFFRSTDGGATWDSLSHLLPPHDSNESSMLDIGAWPNGDVLYRTGWWPQTIMRSTDQGESWLDYSGRIPEFVAGNGGDTLYGASGDPYPSRAGRVFRSTDSGYHWSELESNQIMLDVRSLSMGPDGTLFLGTAIPGLLRSQDGSTWEVISVGTHQVLSLAWTSSQSMFWLDETSTIHRSTDNGSTWITISGNLPPPPYDGIIATGRVGKLYLATHGGMIYRADSMGRDWIETNAGLAGTSISAMASGKNGAMVALTDRTAYTSLENGTGWRVNGLENIGGHRTLRTETGAILALTEGPPIVRSTDGGERWESVSIAGTNPGGMIDLALGPGRRILALGPPDVGVLSSVDDGRTWEPIGIPPSTPYSPIALASSLDGSIYVSTIDWHHPLVRSSDLGAHWEAADSGIPILSRIAMLRGDGHGHLWAAGEGLYRLTTSNTWERSSTGITYGYVSSLYSSSWGTLYAGTADGGVFHSTDMGETWAALPSELQRATVTCFAEDSRGFLYAGTEAHGVFRSVRSFGDTTAGTFVLPDVASLQQNYPNPFNAGTTIRFFLPHSGWSALRIYNVLGEEIAVVHDGLLPAAEHRFVWDGTGQPSGMYFCRLHAGTRTVTRKMLLVR
jgi:photosystem II stability/assembly factor-like uncharacterized protein